ncbi:MAG TPA: IS1595 family transposase [Pyrinomonadaceae bacterium]|nr:IS1595 family transposase [Pyrinomonadaceae bacterium]
MPRSVNYNSAYNLIDLFEKFGDEDRCRLYLEKLRWPKGVQCVRCQSLKISRIKKRNQYHCDACNHTFSVKAGTIFHDSHLSLVKWFMAIFIISEAKKGVSALQLKRTLHVTYKTAWYMCHRIREAVKDVDHCELLSGIVECDETYVGGKAKFMHEDVKKRRGIGGKGYQRTAGKTMVMGAIQRRGDVRLKVGHAPSKEELQAFIRAKIADECTSIMTDENRSYDGVADHNTRHETVDHFKKEWVRGDVHTNTLENVWSLFKRSIIGSYHQLSVKHMDRYLDEFEFRFNNRGNPYLFRDTLLNLLTTSNIEYKQLIGKKEKAA